MSDDTGLMDWRLFTKILKECELQKCPSIKLNWRGEPLIHPLLPDMIRVAKRQAKILEVQINTNAQLLTKEKARKISNAGLDRIIISADGITKQTYEKIRINSSWERLLDNIVYLKQLSNRPIIRIQTCELPQNMEEIGEFTDFWAEYADEIRIWQSFDPMKRKDPRLKRRLKTPCPQLWQRLVVAWNGDVHPCCVDWGSKGILGKVTEKSLKEIWDSPQERYLRHLHRNKVGGIINPCSTCDNYLV